MTQIFAGGHRMHVFLSDKGCRRLSKILPEVRLNFGQGFPWPWLGQAPEWQLIRFESDSDHKI